MMWKIMKDITGKDLSSITLPIFLCEPFSILQKQAEQQLISVPIMEEASGYPEDSCLRMVYIATGCMVGFKQV